MVAPCQTLVLRKTLHGKPWARIRTRFRPEARLLNMSSLLHHGQSQNTLTDLHLAFTTPETHPHQTARCFKRHAWRRRD